MYELYDKETKQLVRVSLRELEQGLESGKLVSSLEQLDKRPTTKKPTTKKATANENKG